MHPETTASRHFEAGLISCTLFEAHQLRFSSPENWDDPYERFFEHNRSHALFALCWCRRAVSDAMWRIYSPDRMSVRIRTTREKLRATLDAASRDGSFTFVIKDVEYLSITDIEERINEIAEKIDTNYDVHRAADALFLKRDAFDHEAEVRVVIHHNSASDDMKPPAVFHVPVDPYDFVEDVMFDPRVNDRFMRVCSYYLREALGFKKLVAKSELYQMPHNYLNI